MERGLCAAATGTDSSEGPLARAVRTVRLHRLEARITLLQCDGGIGLDPSAYDTVTITGMGGDTIAEILMKSPWLLNKRLILQPQTRVSRFADMMGLLPSRQVEAAEGHRRYTIFLFGDD
jgi:tRNA (adenine22-N1)-methyltransferase